MALAGPPDPVTPLESTEDVVLTERLPTVGRAGGVRLPSLDISRVTAGEGRP